METSMIERVQLSQLIRYGYAGFLLVALAALLVPEIVKPAIEAAGPVVAPISVLAIGIFIYVLHRYVIGEFLLYPFTHMLHRALDRIRRSPTSSTVGYLQELGVPFFQRRAAYTDVRHDLLPEEWRRVLDLRHAEAHIIWLTSIECLGASIYLIIINEQRLARGILFSVAVVSMLAGIALDIRQNQAETRMLRKHNENAKVSLFLFERGYITAGPGLAQSVEGAAANQGLRDVELPSVRQP